MNGNDFKYNFVQHNIRDIKTNYYNLQTLITLHRPDIICLQETQLGPNTTLDNKKPINFPDYKIYRKDCKPGKWGVAIMVKQNIPQWYMDINSKLEQVSVKIFYKGKELSVTSLYLTPGIKFKIKDLESLNRQLLNNKIIMTDSNAHHSLWGDSRICSRGRIMSKFTNNHDLIILNKGDPTFITPKGTPKAIDLTVVSPNLAMNAEWFVHTDRLGSDHFPICISYPEDISRVEPSHTYNIKKADWNLYTRYANIQTDTNSTNTDSKYSNILNGIKHAADLSIPKHSPYIKGKIKVPWWTTECRTALNQRNKTFRHFKNHPTQENFINYKKAQAEAKKVIKEAKRKSWREFISNINRNTTRADCWNTIRTLRERNVR